MIVTSTNYIANKKIIHQYGVVSGNTVRAKHLGRDIAAGLKTLVGGEIRGYTEMLADARKQAMYRMVQEAQNLNADAVINVRYATSMVAQGMSEILAYGTAVKIADESP